MESYNYDAVAAGVSGGVLAFYYIFCLAIAVLTVVAMWKIMVKAGKPGWAAIVPFYNAYCMYDIAWGNGWMFLLNLVPCVNIVITIMYCIKLAKAFGKSTGFGVGLIFLNTIFILILGLGDAQYVGPEQK